MVHWRYLVHTRCWPPSVPDQGRQGNLQVSFSVLMLYFPILMCDFRRIRDNEYEFPTDRAISSAVQHLIQQILTPNPSQRPTLHEIVDHAFFTQGPVPSYIPTSAHDGTPDFRHISKSVSDTNLKRLRKYALLDEEYPMAPMPSSTSGGVAASKSITTSIAQQEKEFRRPFSLARLSQRCLARQGSLCSWAIPLDPVVRLPVRVRTSC